MITTMKSTSSKNRVAIDNDHIWHPYSAMHGGGPVYHVDSAENVYLHLSDGSKLIDGMSSWWSTIHGYNHPQLNAAIEKQLNRFAHVMFGGLTHDPAIDLVEKLIELTPAGLQSVFLSDSGSVSVEVAMKMAIQYWNARGMPGKQRFVTIRNGYHGDTLGAMSVCDPVTGMHSLFNTMLSKQFFVDAPVAKFGEHFDDREMQGLEKVLQQHGDDIAALILEPVVQGAGGMRFYSADYLSKARVLCDRYGVLLIADEIATGFGRSGKLFACEHASISPDIMCIGKALTGGYMSLAATLATEEISRTIDSGNPGVFMHGPTFMANPLACAVSLASIRLLFESSWQDQVLRIEGKLEQLLSPCRDLPSVKEVRILGAIGVVEMKQPVDMKSITRQFVDSGVWVRPFGKLIYLMPAYIISDDDLEFLCNAIVRIVAKQPDSI
jgi:adenosylmethionine-8-amino-7-oxononanoate aminotransferase